MPDHGDYHAFKSTRNGSVGSGSGNGIGCVAWIVIGIGLILLFALLIDGADWDSIDSLLGVGALRLLLPSLSLGEYSFFHFALKNTSDRRCFS